MGKSGAVKKTSRKAKVSFASNEKVCSSRDLAVALIGVKLSDDEARTWYHDLASARRRLKRFPLANISMTQGR